MKARVHICRSLSEFKETERKIIKYYERRNPQMLSCPLVQYHLSYEELSQIADGELRLEDSGNNLQTICQEVRANHLKEYSIRGKKYLLTGVQITNEDYYYWLVQPDTGDFQYYSCVGRLDDID